MPSSKVLERTDGMSIDIFMTRYFLPKFLKKSPYETAIIWVVVCNLSTESAFALEKKQGCKYSNTLKGFKGKFRELQANKPEVCNGQIGWNYSK